MRGSFEQRRCSTSCAREERGTTSSTILAGDDPARALPAFAPERDTASHHDGEAAFYLCVAVITRSNALAVRAAFVEWQVDPLPQRSGAVVQNLLAASLMKTRRGDGTQAAD
jgi:hypothetical protein